MTYEKMKRPVDFYATIAASEPTSWILADACADIATLAAEVERLVQENASLQRSIDEEDKRQRMIESHQAARQFEHDRFRDATKGVQGDRDNLVFSLQQIAEGVPTLSKLDMAAIAGEAIKGRPWVWAKT